MHIYYESYSSIRSRIRSKEHVLASSSMLYELVGIPRLVFYFAYESSMDTLAKGVTKYFAYY